MHLCTSICIDIAERWHCSMYELVSVLFSVPQWFAICSYIFIDNIVRDGYEFSMYDSATAPAAYGKPPFLFSWFVDLTTGSSLIRFVWVGPAVWKNLRIRLLPPCGVFCRFVANSGPARPLAPARRMSCRCVERASVFCNDPALPSDCCYKCCYSILSL